VRHAVRAAEGGRRPSVLPVGGGRSDAVAGGFPVCLYGCLVILSHFAAIPAAERAIRGLLLPRWWRANCCHAWARSLPAFFTRELCFVLPGGSIAWADGTDTATLYRLPLEGACTVPPAPDRPTWRVREGGCGTTYAPFRTCRYAALSRTIATLCSTGFLFSLL